jgi:uncharacterized phage protein (TIGR01671 family)
MIPKFRLYSKVHDEFKYRIKTSEVGDLNLYFQTAEGLISQSTGLFDKQGKEIYEGDIVKHKYAVGEEFISNGIMVVGSETPDGHKIVGFQMFDPKCSTTYSFDADDDIQEDVEIIGNIFQNPELLK